MKNSLIVSVLFISLLLAACTSSTCPEDTISYLTQPYPPLSDDSVGEPQLIQINNQEILVDEVITGPVCNDHWSGTLYVTCNIQIPAWEEESTFWKDCDFEVEEGTIIYVEAHGNAPYAKGCSCHQESAD